ncbi:MAG: nucleotidyltransferase domain-containing protein [Cyanothece sp. SIO1E1]|nr:nucleotidyltransferase domain-containing protein [Cyanothece sp. SIO1E1]
MPQSLSSFQIQLTQLEQQRREALSIARKCEAILRQSYGAADVILFGSLAGDGPWHSNSDLDLAVIGLSQAAWLNACDDLAAIAPPWLQIDLVRLESVYPEVRDRILKIKSMPNNKYLALKARLEDELTALERDTKALGKALKRAQPTLEEYDIRALASYVNDVYKRLERMSERVVVTLDGKLPQGDNWHQALLYQVAESGSDGRPPLWSRSLLLDLDEYRKFRHLVHHKYGEELRANRVVTLAELAPSIFVQVGQALASLSEWLLERAAK